MKISVIVTVIDQKYGPVLKLGNPVRHDSNGKCFY